MKIDGRGWPGVGTSLIYTQGRCRMPGSPPRDEEAGRALSTNKSVCSCPCAEDQRFRGHVRARSLVFLPTSRVITHLTLPFFLDSKLGCCKSEN